MPRPKKSKNVCKIPDIKIFKSNIENDNIITLSVEEFEVIRLMDKEGLNQEECSIHMKVSRPTIQILYADARKKVADFLTTGGTLQIKGGTYEVCQNKSDGCNCTHCNC